MHVYNYYFAANVCHSPVADPPVLDTVTVISVDDGLLRTSTGCAGPSASLTLYTDWLKDIVMSIRTVNMHTYICMYVCINKKLHN